MAKFGELQYKVECTSCGKQFLVDRVDEQLPKHSPKGETTEPHMPIIPCIGSNTPGSFLETKTKGFD
jgi:hypothetical protein